MREHWESVLANKNWIKSERDPKVCVAAVCLVSKLVARFILLWWMKRIERKTHMYVHPQICVSTDIYSCCLYILYCMMLVSCMYCTITQCVFSSVKASCSDLGLSVTHIPSKNSLRSPSVPKPGWVTLISCFIVCALHVTRQFLR